MGKKRIPKSVIVNIEIRTQRIPDRRYQELVEMSERRNNIDSQIPELPNISLRSIDPFSARNDGELKEAEKYFLKIWKGVLKRKPVRIIFQKKRRR